MVSGESKILLNLCSQVVWLVFLLLFLVLLRIESATEVEGEKCSSLEYVYGFNVEFDGWYVLDSVSGGGVELL